MAERDDAGHGAATRAAACFEDYILEQIEGEVVLDVIHRIQASEAPDLACRWNCKAGKCGSCSAEINGKPRLMCMTRMDSLPEGPVDRRADEDLPDHPRPRDRRLVQLRPGRQGCQRSCRRPMPEGGYRMFQEDVERGQEFRKCIECFMCQDVCHVIRDHEEQQAALRRTAVLHPLRRTRDAPARHERPARLHP